jgi:hypothetical protein
MADQEYMPLNQESDPRYNREPGIVMIPGSNYAKERAKFEMDPGPWGNPGRPRVHHEYPMMVYRAELYNGKACCMAAPPNPNEFANPDEFRRAEERAAQFTKRCQMIVKNEHELQKAREAGFRAGPDEAVAYLDGREQDKANVTAQRNYEDRNLSDVAKREVAAAEAEAGGEHLPEIPEKPIRRRAAKKTGPKRKYTRRKKV